MITLFEDFNNDIDDIRKYLRRTRNGKILIPSVSYDILDEERILNPEDKKYAKYNSLMRFLVYYKLLTYDGNNPTILKYIAGIKSGDLEKIEIINKLGNNHHVMDIINKKFNFNITDYKYDDETGLLKILNNWKQILGDFNFIEYLGIVSHLSEKAKISEKIVKGVVNMLYGKYYEIKKAELADDLRGVDIWLIGKKTGVRKSMQVKNIPGSLNIVNDNIYINNTRIDLHDYVKSFKTPPPYDYLGFYSERDKQVCIINSSVIYAIEVDTTQKAIHIKITKWGMEPDHYSSVVKIIDVPAKFLPKDYSKIFV
jgi:hypothetical protein